MSGTGGVVGRDRELAAVTAFLDALPSGTSCLLLEGTAGIGKTTVWDAGVAGSAARSYLILSSRPAESEATLSFAALGDLMDGVLGRVLPQLPPPRRRALEVALLMEDPVGSPPEQRAVCLAFLGVIRHLSASGPVVIAIDDLQWLDRPSAAALEFALRRLGSEPVGLLASVRIQAGGQATSAAGAGLPGRAPHAYSSRSLDSGRFRGGAAGIGRRLAFPADGAPAFRCLGREPVLWP